MANNLKQLRKKAAVTQLQLAAQCGWPDGQSRISNYENGSRVPTLEDARALAAALCALGVACTLDDIFPPSSVAA